MTTALVRIKRSTRSRTPQMFILTVDPLAFPNRKEWHITATYLLFFSEMAAVVCCYSYGHKEATVEVDAMLLNKYLYKWSVPLKWSKHEVLDMSWKWSHYKKQADWKAGAAKQHCKMIYSSILMKSMQTGSIVINYPLQTKTLQRNRRR